MSTILDSTRSGICYIAYFRVASYPYHPCGVARERAGFGIDDWMTAREACPWRDGPILRNVWQYDSRPLREIVP